MSLSDFQAAYTAAVKDVFEKAKSTKPLDATPEEIQDLDGALMQVRKLLGVAAKVRAVFDEVDLPEKEETVETQAEPEEAENLDEVFGE